MDILQLPEEIFLNIVKYLTANDLLSCSLVNYSWRNAINRNEIWHNICKNLINSSSGDELDHMNSLVRDSSDHNPYSAVDFEPLCKWRRTFMRWVKLKNNWQEGYYKRFKISEFVTVFSCLEFFDSSLLIVSDDTRELSVWDIKNVPYHRENMQFALSHVRSDFVKLCNNYLVIVQCNLLQVYYNTDEGFQFLYRSLFDKDEICSKILMDVHNMTQWYCENVDLYPCDLLLRCEQNGYKFIGLILDGDFSESVLHIWDLDKKSKKTCVTIPRLSATVFDVNFSVTERYLYIMMLCEFRDKNSYNNSVVVFDLEHCQFLEFKLNFSYGVPAFIFYKSFILAVDKTWDAFSVWKTNSNFIKKIEYDYQIDSKCFNVEGSHILTAGKQESQNSTWTVSVYNISDVNCVYTSAVSYYIIDFISLIQSNFLILGGFECARFLSVIDIANDNFLYTIKNDDCLFINSTHSKLITRNDNDELFTLSFW